MLRKTVLAVFLTVALCLIGLVQPANAADLENGGKLFKANCIGCHLGGNNSVVKPKTLKAEALQEYKMNSVEAIVTQVTNGKGGMPAFGKKLKPEEIENIANYVLAQSEAGWPKLKK